jgi:NADP-dependent 3-hydroxy acid dehydrogenase YdfG
VSQIAADGGAAHAFPADLGDSSTVEAACRTAEQTLGSIDVLVNCAGTNVPNRRLDGLSVTDWDSMIATNLSGAFYCVRSVLPGMRGRGNGQIIHVSSLAGARPSVLSGAAYSASKAGLNALSACTNLEEKSNGIRSCVILSGDINTELLDKRPNPPDGDARSEMLTVDDVARTILFVIQQPPHVLIDEITVRPSR